MILSLFPKPVPSEQFSRISEFVTRANYGMVNGNFALNMDEGDIHHKMTGHFNDASHFDQYLTFLLRESSESLAKYANGIDKAINGQEDIKAIVSEIENA